ncbi:TAXI family TRAP transporter solute-binding subunit [Lentimicrobium sp. S6]|uniref:TAXI family TRAP transporter solute-binding subunit n=1 Tax=Lentimicrobium sp. S6 TaxID=2735872 RepID=UPI001552E510|nr:TAXI family TRAP transporter solute-binding subunit [Lentimicrobium sp. S6]NPD46198.1 TAXI family TRAP transporter solute-binding subunit [Lentimicrobium sp. S6]
MKYNKLILFTAITFLTVFFSSCNNDKKSLVIAALNKGTSNFQAGELIVKELKNDIGINFRFDSTAVGSLGNVKLLMENKADFAIIQNTLDYEDLGYSKDELNRNIRTVLPLYTHNLFIIYQKADAHQNIVELFRGKKVGLGPKDGGTAWFVEELLSYYGLQEGDYTPVYTKYNENMVGETIDISCSVTSYNNPRIVSMMRNPELDIFSLGNPSNIAIGGSSVNGINLRNNTLFPFIIPKDTYVNTPTEPTLTISTFGVLICRVGLDEDLVYNMMESIVQNKALIITENPIFNIIHEEFNHSNLRFPLHDGVNMYLDRSKPSFLVKYAEVIALIITLLVIFSGSLRSLNNWSKLKKKNRIDVYYQKIIDLDIEIKNSNSKDKLQELVIKIFKIRDEAFKNLIDEKLIADESFNIFLRIQEDSLKRIYRKQEELE